jgi:kinesin family member 3B
MIRERFSSLAEELEFQTNKLHKLVQKYDEAQNFLLNVEDDFDRERNDMYDTIYELTNQLKLKNMIIEYMIPPEEYRKYEKIAEWSEEQNDWVIANPTQYKDLKTGSKRPQSAVGMKRPTSEYSRIAKGLGDLNPRYKFENILQLDLDMPERTTEDY